MGFKLKALLSSLGAVAVAVALMVVPAPAETGGHFTSEANETVLFGYHIAIPAEFTAFGNTIACYDATYEGELPTKTETQVTITPTYLSCGLVGLPNWKVAIDMKGCDYLLTIRKTNPNSTDNTVHLICPKSGPIITITPNDNPHHCTLEVTPNITPTGGIVYPQKGAGGADHYLDAEMTVTGIHVVRLTGALLQCMTFATTDAAAELKGTARVIGKDKAGNPRGVTATGG